jgi:hypothetical protein
MKKTTIKAVEMVRRIRDAHYEQLRGKSPEERIAFYRAKARGLQAEIAAQRQEQSTNELQPA